MYNLFDWQVEDVPLDDDSASEGQNCAWALKDESGKTRTGSYDKHSEHISQTCVTVVPILMFIMCHSDDGVGVGFGVGWRWGCHVHVHFHTPVAAGLMLR